MSDDLFLKFDGVQGEAEDGRVHRDFDALGHQFGDLGDGFLKLIDDVSSANLESIHKVADDAHINHDLLKIDTAFLNFDDSFLKLDTDFLKFGDGITNFLENDLKITPTPSSEESSSLSGTFLKIHSDFQNAAIDFHTLATDFLTIKFAGSSELNPFSTVARDFHNIDEALLRMSTDFNALGTDFIKIGESSDSQPGESLSLNFGHLVIKYGEAAQKAGASLDALSSDFHRIGDVFLNLSDSETIKLDQAFLKFADDFLKLGADSLKLDASLHLLGEETLKVNELLHIKLDTSPVPVPIPGDHDAIQAVTEQVHQLAQHAKDFHL